MSPPGLRSSAIVLSSTLLGAALAAGPSHREASAPNRLVPVMPAARQPDARLLGAVPATARIDGAVGLRPRHEALLAAYVARVTTPGNPLFRHYLSEADFVRRFGPAPATLHRLEHELGSEGVRVTSVSANRLLVGYSGSARAVESAFHTDIDDVVLRNGRRGREAVAPVRLSARLAPQVTVVTGLDDLVAARPEGISHTTGASPVPAHARLVRPAPGGPHACKAATAAAVQLGGLTDDEVASSYGAFGLYRGGDTGAGQSIAVFELEPFARSDIATFDTCYFGAGRAAAMLTRLRVHAVDGGQPSGPGLGEASLDVENLSAIAPGARIDVYEAPDTNTGALDDYNAIVAADADDVVTTSWGLCETALQQGSPGSQQEEDFIFEEAAAQGQTVFAASGDYGSDDCNTFETPLPVRPILSVDDPGSQPYVVSAGGTTIFTASEPPRESVWNDGPSGGAGGGGISNTWVMASWQAATGVEGVAPAGVIASAERLEGDRFCAGNKDGSTFGGRIGEPCREVPDVSADADEFTGAITVYSRSEGGWSTVGGTSSAAPIWAASLALVNASPFCSADSVPFSGRRLHTVGFASPLLYRVASSPSADRASFTDVTAGTNDIFGLSSGRLFHATSGYDMATGLGSPQLSGPSGSDGLAYYLCTYGRSGERPSVSALVPDVLSAASGNATIRVRGSGFAASGKDEVRRVSVGNFLVPPDDVTVEGPRQLVLSHLPPGRDLLPTGGSGNGAGAATVTITLDGGTSSPPVPAARLEVVARGRAGSLPSVSGVSPSGGGDHGGGTVTVFGSGFRGATSVTFGGVASSRLRVQSDEELATRVPAFSSATRCATPLNPSTNICQVEVVVRTRNGTSRPSLILPPYSGPVAFNGNGVVTPPPRCGCEVAPALSEYDYLPPPRITSVSTSAGPGSYASEEGSSTVTLKGTGLGNIFSTIGVPIGPLGQFSSWGSIVSYDSPSELQVIAPNEGPSVRALSVPIRVVTTGGASPAAAAVYAGFPNTRSVEPHAFPATGGGMGTLRGIGLGDTTYLEFLFGNGSAGTLYQFKTAAGLLRFASPQENPGKVFVRACSVSGCGSSRPAATALLYPPGNPSLSGIRPRTGKAHGRSWVVIHGTNLSCATAVFFGRRRATFHNVSTLLTCGSSTAIVARAPPGRAGTTVAVRVETVESESVGYGKTRRIPAGTFRYVKSSPSGPRDVRLRAGTASLLVRWREPISDGGSRIVAFVVRAVAHGFAPRVKVLGPGTRSYLLTGLARRASWTVTVRARNRLGSGLPVRRTARPLPHRHSQPGITVRPT